MALGGCGVREPAIPGAAIRARAAVSAAPATNRLGRTISARYDDSRLPATSPGCRAWTTPRTRRTQSGEFQTGWALAPALANLRQDVPGVGVDEAGLVVARRVEHEVGEAQLDVRPDLLDVLLGVVRDE